MSGVAKLNEIIKGLREYVKYVPSIDGVAILIQAADLIESLQAELDRITSERDNLKAAMPNWHEGEVE